jgi:heat shock protein HslJ
MKTIVVLLPFLIIALLLAAGCTGQQAAPQPTAVPATQATPAATATPAVPADLARSWTLTSMAIQNGTAVNYPTAAISLTIRNDGTLYGYTGCNNYNAGFTLSGEVTDKGKKISIGPVESTLKYCQGISDQEHNYLEILGDVYAYNIDGVQLSMTATDGNVLIFQTPVSLATPSNAPGY